MHKIFIGNEEININEEAYSYLVNILINFPFIDQIEFVLDDIFISPNLDEDTLTNILTVIYYSLKIYLDNLIGKKDASIIDLSYSFNDEQSEVLSSKLIKPSYKLIIKIDMLVNSLNDIMGLTK